MPVPRMSSSASGASATSIAGSRCSASRPDLERFLADALGGDRRDQRGGARAARGLRRARDACGERRWFANHGLLGGSDRVGAGRRLARDHRAGARGGNDRHDGLGDARSALPRARKRADRTDRRGACAPVGDCPLRGVLYLQGRVSEGPFTADDRAGRRDLRPPSRSDRGTTARPRTRAVDRRSDA